MSANFTTDPLSDSQISGHAFALRRYHGIGDLDVPDVFFLLGRDAILTRFGEKKFEHQVVDDIDLGGDEAITLITNDHVRVRVSRSTCDCARDQDRRARMTIAHELMHGVLHRNVLPLARARQETVKRVVAPYISVERQANVGASAYLISDAMVKLARSPAELADNARVSPQAADIRWEQEQNRATRGPIRDGLWALKAELVEASKPPAVYPEALQCPVCGNFSLIPIGIRYLCTGPCNRAVDVFADGDGPT